MSEIDVSKCKHFSMGYCKADSFMGVGVECNNKDCYFKQLQQLKQENEELKQENVILQEAVEYHNLVKCPKCGYYSLPEYICHNCGYEESEE